jgi:hypothetical protein
MASDDIKAILPSLIIPEISPQIISPDARYGRNVWIGAPKMVPKTIPIVAIVTAIPIVIHSCPKKLLRYD